MNALLQQIELLGIVPVVVIDNAENAEPLAEALIAGGLPCIEITLRTEAGLRALTEVRTKFPAMLVGAGTVLSVDQAKAAIDHGAQWIVSPGLNPRVVDFCLANNMTITPGVSTPTEVALALDAGLSVLKFFPAEQNGGVEYLRALAGPYRTVRFIPTGGVSEENLLEYLRMPGVLACGGSWMVKSELIAAKNFAQIRALTERAVKKMLAFELRHVGMNTAGPDAALPAAARLAEIFNLPERDTPGSIFVGTEFEVLKRTYLGTHGHVAIGTPFIERAVSYLERRGIVMDPETRNVRDGKLHAVYFKEEIAGFAFHLIQL